MQNIINSEDISVVVQGPINKKYTYQSLISIKKYLPNAQVILSTWENSNVAFLDGLYDDIIFNKDPNAVIPKGICCHNVNRMVVSTNEGIKRANRKYILKIRSDVVLDNLNFLDIFDKFNERNDKYKLFEHKILASTLFSKIYVRFNKLRKCVPFHVSDWWFFGLTTDVKKFLLASEVVDEPYFSNYFKEKQNASKDRSYKNIYWKFAPEQYIGYSCFSKYFDDIRMIDCSDINDEIIKNSDLCLMNNFVFLEHKQSGLRNLKYPYSGCELFYGDEYIDLYTHYMYELKYKSMFDNNYKPSSQYSIYYSNIIGYDILRLYKHLYKLYDKNISFKMKLEQIFFALPYTIFKLLISILKYIYRILKIKTIKFARRLKQHSK